jgi:predicted Zn-dependent peptidase
VSPQRLDPAQPVGSTRTLLGEDQGGLVRRTVLPGGLRVITEAMPTVRSVSIGIWVGVGSRDESPALAGASHFLEHLLFKGTAQRSALDISAELDAVGGEMNAFTGKEYTCYHARVIDSDLPLAVDVLVDMVTRSRLAAPDVESERGVILEEIAMNDDDPDDVVHDLICTQAWGDSPLGRPIAGLVSDVEGLTREQIVGHHSAHYRPHEMVVAVAGNLDHDVVVGLVRDAFGSGLEVGGSPTGLRPSSSVVPFSAGACLVHRPTEQANLVLGLPGLHRLDERRHAAGVLTTALGGGMSSRLFQEVRERRGLAYSVYAFGAAYADTGLFGVYAGCAPGKAEQVLSLCREQLALAAKDGLDTEELERAKGQLRGSIVLSLEDSGSRMSRIGKADLLQGEVVGLDEAVARVNAVTLDDVHDLAQYLLTPDPALAVVGPFEDADRFSAAVG